MSYTQPKHLEQALTELAGYPKRPILLAGGTDWMVERQLHQPAIPPTVMDLSQVPELTAITVESDGIRIGAMVTYRQLIEDPRFAPWSMLGEMAQQVGARQIQARGTLGGNVATGSPAGDSLPVLLAYGAEVKLASIRGVRRVPLERFYTGYRQSAMATDELIQAIFLPTIEPGAQTMYRKVGTRRAQAISKVAFAGYSDGEVCRLGMASVGPTVMPLYETRAVLLHGGDPIAALHRDIKPIDDVRSTGRYRYFVAENLVRAFSDQIHTPA